MAPIKVAGQDDISDTMVVAGQIYLGTCGAIDDPSLGLSKAFAEHMLGAVLDEAGEPYGRISREAQSRAVEYFAENRDPEDPMSITYSYFVRGLLSYAFTGVDPYAPDVSDTANIQGGEGFLLFPVKR